MSISSFANERSHTCFDQLIELFLTIIGENMDKKVWNIRNAGIVFNMIISEDEVDYALLSLPPVNFKITHLCTYLLFFLSPHCQIGP